MSYIRDMNEKFFAELEASIVRREFLYSHPPHCPKCGTEQVEIRDKSIPARWKCRHCKHKFVYEPIKKEN